MTLIQKLTTLIDANIRNKTPKVVKIEHANVAQAIADAICIPYQVIEQDCPQQFVDDNFDNTGLGINLMDGYAICNGNNNTQDRRRKSSIGYDPALYITGNNYSLLGNTFGSEKNTLIKDNLPSGPIPTNTNLATGSGDGVVRQRAVAETGGTGSVITVELGISAPINNLQPSIVTLFIQRI